MNREIKFRGKRVDNGEWVQGFLIKSRVVDDGHCSCEWVYSIQVEHLNNGSYYKYMIYEIETPTVGQFTGLTDKNSVEIYEGDLVKDELTRASIVEFRTGAFCIEGVTLDNHLGYLWSNGYNNVEVVGNIHEVAE